IEFLESDISRTEIRDAVWECGAVNDGIFKGLHLHESLTVSHLFYADDAVFIGEWSHENLVNLVRILKCFHLASGLKINLLKNHVLGTGVSDVDVSYGASMIGCDIMHTPFKYLGVLVGSPMSRISAWADTIQKIQSRSLFFNGIDPLERKIIWVAWEKILASKKKGGLGVSSLFALNRALLLKWVWRFVSNDGSLWSQVINVIHGKLLGSHSVRGSSPWCSILREMQSLAGKVLISCLTLRNVSAMVV
nr:RNA-directed DNA polymerase, eukaryota, reverse transcriptase zinc-binding domain protein [Tanacetum cinerariifolium]